MMLKGLTAQFLLRRTYKVGPETTLCFTRPPAASGDRVPVGGGARRHRDRHRRLRRQGLDRPGSRCAHVINYREEDFVTMVKAYTKGQGVDVVYDSVGKDTFPASLDCLKPLGMWVSFGQASGPVPEFKISLLSQKGSLYATRPSLFHYTEARKDLVSGANELFEMVTSGKVKVAVNQTYQLDEAARAHRDLEGRLTTGSTVLLPADAPKA